jgi:hypothetical protein
MKCMDCPLKYVWKMGCTYYNRYKEHIWAINNNKGNSEYSNHILSTEHTYGSITDTINIINREKRKTPNYIRKILLHKISKKQITHE